MAKTTKKKNRKLKRQIRKTVGALLMVSAITVAAIPVQDVSANPTDTSEKVIKVAVYSEHPTKGNETTDQTYKSSVPHAKDRTETTNGKNLEQIIYTSGNGLFQFVYIRPTTTNPNKVAMILGYNGNVLTDSTLTIPDQLEAFKKYSDNVTSDGYCLVSKLDEFLYYQVQEQLKNDAGYLLYDVVNYVNPDTGEVEAKRIAQNEAYKKDGTDVWVYRAPIGKDEKDNFIYEEYALNPVTGPVYYPCYYDNNRKADDQIWSKIKDEELYYKNGKNDDGTDKYTAAGDDTNHWKIKADVAYIGAETIKDDGKGGWVLADYITQPGQGVFAGNTNITNLNIGSNMRGISDFAFYNCGTLNSITLANGLTTIGNGAFAECRNLQTFKIESNALIEAIGKDAFYNCRSLREFTVPIGVKALGDNCFEECAGLVKINFLGDGSSQMYLQTLGNHLFRNCSSLAEVEFPETYVEGDLDIDMFKGCTSLQRVIVHNDDLNFNDNHSKDNTNYPNCSYAWEDFRKELPNSFYFEGPLNSSIRDTANQNSVTYKYPNQELYEKVERAHSVNDTDPNAKSARVIYRVDNSGDLVYFGKLSGSDDPDILEIPEQIGSFSIQRIAQGSFNNNCYLKKVTIPASVTEIGANAFKGCHALRSVTFTDASTITSIGADAFKTQEVVCEHADGLYPATGAEEPELYFVGAMLNEKTGLDTVPFQYAMNGSSKISHDKSPNVWITCHSGWPTNLEVRYNDGEAQLVGYPRYDQLDDEWINNLPYVLKDSEQADEYKQMVNHVKDAILLGNTSSLTPEEQAFLVAIQKIVIPASVASIREGLFSGVNAKGEPVDKNGNVVTNADDGIGADKKLQSILINGVKELDSYTFKDCEKLTQAEIIGSELIDDYVFDSCKELSRVTLGTNLKDTGKRPFSKCEKLTNIYCLEPSNFIYNNIEPDGILYRQTSNGLEIVECLEGRGKADGSLGSKNVGPDELEGVVAIKDEAFSGCLKINNVDLSKTKVDTIPQGCFKGNNLFSVTLPKSLGYIDKEAFQNGKQDTLSVYFKSNPVIEDEAFRNTITGETQQDVIFQTNSAIPINYAKKANNAFGKEYIFVGNEINDTYFVEHYIYPDGPVPNAKEEKIKRQEIKNMEEIVSPSLNEWNYVCDNPRYLFSGWENRGTDGEGTVKFYAQYDVQKFTVTFKDWYTKKVIEGYDAIIKEYGQGVSKGDYPEPPDHTDENMRFDDWNYDDGVDPTNVTSDIVIWAFYEKMDDDNTEYCSISLYCDDTGEPWLVIPKHPKGTIYTPPKVAPAKEGYTFKEWRWTPADSKTVVNQNTILDAQYTQNSSSNNGGSGNGSGSSSGSGSGNGSGSGSNSSPSPSPSVSPTPEPTPGVKKYTVSVSGGSGSGEYAAGEIVAVNAYYMGEGQVFDKWTSSTAGVGFSNPNATSATFTMPAANVAVTATYKTGSGSSVTPVSSSGGGSNTVNTVSNNGTVVDITRPGISNTNLAGATVSGATDNFIVKVTEDQIATDAATAALQARYGDLSRIKYLPMDISLYDSTGRTKIADTSGISVNLTIPLPDELVQYAGNNRVAAISGGVLEDLNARFTTVGGVPCVNFTATHFSPYVIYVDTANLSEAVIDATPKTGDPIHPKWFLAIGLACISLILFFKRDKVIINTKTA